MASALVVGSTEADVRVVVGVELACCRSSAWWWMGVGGWGPVSPCVLLKGGRWEGVPVGWPPPIFGVPPVCYQSRDVGLARRVLVMCAPSARLQEAWAMPR